MTTTHSSPAEASRPASGGMSVRRRSFGLIAVLMFVVGCSGSSTDLRKEYIDEIDKLEELQFSRTEMIATLPDAARKTLGEHANVTAQARLRYFAAVEAKDDLARKAATADEIAANRVYDEAAEALLLEHVSEYKELQKRIAEQAERVERAKERLDASRK